MNPSMNADFDGISIRIELPELKGYDGEIRSEHIERAVDALCAHISQTTHIYLDGEESPPATVHVECWDVDGEENWRLE